MEENLQKASVSYTLFTVLWGMLKMLQKFWVRPMVILYHQ